MLKIKFTTAEIDALRHWRFDHPHPQVQLKMEALYLKSQGVAEAEIIRLCAISRSTFYRYRHQYLEGGIERLPQLNLHRQQSPLAEHRSTIEAYFREHPPATISQACATVEALTGIKRGPTQVRQFLKSLGMRPRKVGQLPAKADLAAQEQFQQESLEPRLEQAKAGQRVVFFMDAAHFVFAPFLGWVWCFERLFVKAPSGRQRLNVLAALNATTRALCTVRNLTSSTAETVCELLRLLAGASPGVPLTIVLDHARYQRCALVQRVAHSLGVELLYLPAYSPHLNLIERFWKFIKRKCLYSKYYADHAAFQQAIIECIEQSPNKFKEELASLLTLKFQTFKEVPVIGEESKVCLFPVAKQAQKKVSSKAA